MAEVQERNFFEIEGPKPDVNYPIKVRYCGGTNFTIHCTTNFTYQINYRRDAFLLFCHCA